MRRLLTLFASCFLLVLHACSGDRAPEFKLKDINAQKHSLAAYRGKVVMLHFWTDWCNACRAEFPRIQNYYQELQGEDFELLAINVGQPVSASQDFHQDFSITFPMLTDTESAVGQIYGVEAYPTNYFIDPEGKIIRKIIGWVDKKQVEVIINQHKKAKSIARTTAQQP